MFEYLEIWSKTVSLTVNCEYWQVCKTQLSAWAKFRKSEVEFSWQNLKSFEIWFYLLIASIYQFQIKSILTKNKQAFQISKQNYHSIYQSQVI